MISIISLEALYNLCNAFFDAHRIKKGERIYHGINLLFYVVYCLVLYHFFYCSFYFKTFQEAVVEIITKVIPFMLCAGFNRQLTFDIALNKIRGLDWFYVSPAPKFPDNIEQYLLGRNGKRISMCYFILLIIFTTILILIK